MPKPTRIDALLRGSHVFLREGDECFAFGEYTPRAGFGFGATNDLVSNLKKRMDRAGTPEWPFKRAAIERAAEILTGLDRTWLAETTLVPMPPSACEADPLYDDRMHRILLRLAERTGLRLDIRKLLVQTASTRASSRSAGQRLRPEELRALYRLDDGLLRPMPEQVAVVDDLLTSGAHFRAAHETLRRRWPEMPVFGIFLARTVR